MLDADCGLPISRPIDWLGHPTGWLGPARGFLVSQRFTEAAQSLAKGMDIGETIRWMDQRIYGRMNGD